MYQTNLKKLFEAAGLEAIRPTDDALIKMGMSRRRFTLLLENNHATALTVPELEALKAWIEGIKAIDSGQIVGDYSPESELAESIGLTK